MKDTVATADYADIQALVFRGWKSLPYAAYVFVRLADRVEQARAWLAEHETEVAWASEGKGGDPNVSAPRAIAPVQLAFKPEALRKLGVPEAVLDRFPQEAKVGMEARARILGDRVDADNQPADWELDLRRADTLVIVYAPTAKQRDELVALHRVRAEKHGGELIAAEISSAWRDREPFGFSDGLAQPLVRGQPRKDLVPPAVRNDIAAGEVLLGYQNEYGHMPKSPRYEAGDGLGREFDIGTNGSFLVFRKLEQDVGGFWRTLRVLGEGLRGETVGADGWQLPSRAEDVAEWLAARAMGRWTNGNSTMTHDRAPGERLAKTEINQFTYADDPHGLKCPIGSHVRRANPRDQRGGGAEDSWKVVNRHRILRRGRAYGESITPAEAMAGAEPPVKCGLLFVALQANIAHGFEFVQQIWNNNPGFHGLYQERDPIAGSGGCRFTIPAEPVRLSLQLAEARKDAVKDEDPRGLPRFVIPRGGGYFFLPSRRAIAVLQTGR